MNDYERAEALIAAGVTTAEEVMELLRASKEEPTATEEAPAVTPTPTPTPATTDDDSPLARAQRALEEEAERATLVAGAKALIKQRIGEDPEGFSDDELLFHAGLAPNPNESERERAVRERMEYENRLATDPALKGEYDALMRDRQVEELRRSYWQLHPSQRQQRVEELGLTDFEPPNQFNGLS